MSRYIAKAKWVYLEKPEGIVIWNEGVVCNTISIIFMYVTQVSVQFLSKKMLASTPKIRALVTSGPSPSLVF